jgi:thiol-disulfide isomerase/thioredoxin
MSDNERTRRAMLGAMAGLVAGLAGCLGSDNTNVSGEEPDGGITSEGQQPPTWLTATLTDVTTGEKFTIADADQPTVLHTFETWCPKCQRQQGTLDTLYQQRGDELQLVDLNIDSNFSPDEMRSYAANNGYGWRFGIASNEVMGSLTDDFGQSVSIAPQAPVIVVCPDGTAYELGKGVSADEISSAIEDVCR